MHRKKIERFLHTMPHRIGQGMEDPELCRMTPGIRMTGALFASVRLLGCYPPIFAPTLEDDLHVILNPSQPFQRLSSFCQDLTTAIFANALEHHATSWSPSRSSDSAAHNVHQPISPLDPVQDRLLVVPEKTIPRAQDAKNAANRYHEIALRDQWTVLDAIGTWQAIAGIHCAAQIDAQDWPEVPEVTRIVARTAQQGPEALGTLVLAATMIMLRNMQDA